MDPVNAHWPGAQRIPLHTKRFCAHCGAPKAAERYIFIESVLRRHGSNRFLAQTPEARSYHLLYEGESLYAIILPHRWDPRIAKAVLYVAHPGDDFAICWDIPSTYVDGSALADIYRTDGGEE